MEAWRSTLVALTCGSGLAQPAPEGIVELLRSPCATVDSLSYRVTITLPRERKETTSPNVTVIIRQEDPGPVPPLPDLVVHVACDIRGDVAEARIEGIDGSVGMHWTWLEDRLTFRLLPEAGQVAAPDGPYMTVSHAEVEQERDTEIMRHSTLGMLLLSAAHSLDLSRLTWTQGDPELTGEQVYEARTAEDSSGATRTWRYWFDPAQGYVTRVLALDADDEVIADTTYDMPHRTAQGATVPLRATTTIPAGTHVDRATIGGELHEVRFPRPAQTAVTTFEWQEEQRIRLPIRREVTDGHGKTVCTIDFSDYEL